MRILVEWNKTTYERGTAKQVDKGVGVLVGYGGTEDQPYAAIISSTGELKAIGFAYIQPVTDRSHNKRIKKVLKILNHEEEQASEKSLT